MGKSAVSELARFRRKAIRDLKKLKRRYLAMIDDAEEEDKSRVDRLERAARLLPGLIKTEENLLTSVEEGQKRKVLEESLEPLFAVLHRVLGAVFESKREEIIAALEAELKSNGS